MSRRHHHEPPPPACCSCCGCGCGCGCGSGSSAPAPCGYYPAPSPPPPASGSDHLLHAIAAHLLLTSAPPPPPPQHQHQHQPHPQQQPPPAPHHANLYSYAYQYQHPKSHAAYPQAPPPPPPPQQQQQQANPPDHGHLLLHSLLRRVAALETTLPHCFPSPPGPLPHLQPNPRPQYRAAVHQQASPSPPPSRRARGGAPSARELAARTIQEHFRRFLARRSRTLRQLKELAILRFKAASLRGSLSGSGRRRCGDPAAISEAAMGLLLHLDGIQGGDPMIWEGKRAASRELSRILEFVNKVLVKEHEEMAIGGELDNDEYREGCRGAFVVNRPTMNKKVSFYGNEAENEADESSESSSCSSSAEADERKATNGKKSANGKPGLAAPVPVHMESRSISGENR